MKAYTEMSAQELAQEYKSVQAKFEELKGMALKLNMARGKPGKEQLDLVSDILSILPADADFMSDGIETRN